ncbi:DUF445 domain-containing protein [Litoribrevibacter albus]|uniref:DUF445 family protein n=1 Tax=Litoribrevibacter albus TaxID=1473156 RepID=A0AA37W6F2_9GAMM|nr:DUF445 family protein [Litoribrevibacter albus]GLQ29819.1 hypothetical protein GCM10007876_02970 [Litoribrevibacter albus]
MIDQSIGLHWLLLIPIIAGFIGWITNWLAIKMIFYPRVWRGVQIGRFKFGWQGIIHRKSSGFAKAIGKQVSENMLQAEDLLPKVNIQHAQAFVNKFPELWKEIEGGEFLPDMLGEHWQKMTPLQQQMVKMQIRFDSHSLLLELVKIARAKFVERFDIRRVISHRLSKDSRLLAELFGSIARPELRMIEVYGLYFGAIIGAIEGLLFAFTEMSWTIFLFGTLVGAITNWLAIEMIFRPREPTKILGVTFQGLFPKRQSNIAAQFAQVGEQHVLPVTAFVDEIMSVLEEKAFIDDLEQTARRILHRIIGNYLDHLPEGVSKDEIADKAIEFYYQRQLELEPQLVSELKRLLEADYRVAEIIEANLSELSKEKFERVLRIVFEQDETTLVVIGAVIGFAISGMQFLMFA